MAVVPPIPNGWQKWVYAKNIAQGVHLPDAAFPVLYTPASAFRMVSLIDHCAVQWLQVLDPFTLFLFFGGTTGSLAGTIGALDIMHELDEISVATGDFGLFQTSGGRGPQMGFTIGSTFKQQAFVRFVVQNAPVIGTLYLGSALEFIENSRYKRVYVNHGEIVRYTTIGVEHILTLDIDISETPEDVTISDGTTITISGPSHEEPIVLSVIDIKSNWDIVVSDPSFGSSDEVVIQAGDFYQLNTTWAIEDPFLITGWGLLEDGTENNTNLESSGLNLIVTDQNQPYVASKFLGTYIWKNESADVSDSSVSQVASSQPSVGTDMRDVDDFEWAFYSFDNNEESRFYSNNTRYKENILKEPVVEDSLEEGSEEVTVNVFLERGEASLEDYQSLVGNENTEYIRVEIAQGAQTTRHNWYASNLEGSYINVGEKFYKILAHVEAFVIDVSIKSVDGEGTFSPIENQNYSIINQNAWVTVENYFQSISDFSYEGLFQGAIKSIDGSTFVIEALGDPVFLTNERFSTSLAKKYKIDNTLPKSIEKFYKKQQDWKLVTTLNDYAIESVVFSDPEVPNKPYNITVVLTTPTQQLSVGESVYIAFDDPYETTQQSYNKKTGNSITLEAEPGLDDAGAGLGFIRSNELCLSGQYESNPYVLDIPLGTRIGITDGYLFGLELNNTALSRTDQFMLFTIPRAARGIASFFHRLRQEDWAAYENPNTGKITLRLGSYSNKEFPIKSMVSIGEEELEDTLVSVGDEGSGAVELNTSQEWLRRIEFRIPEIENGTSPGIFFGIGSVENTYGFYVSGDGLVDLRLLRKEGFNEGDVDSNEWSWDGNTVSPTYIYKRNYYQNILETTTDIGIKTSEGPLYFKEGAPDNNREVAVENVTAHYVNENQILSDVGFFDMTRIPDGNTILIYGHDTEEFQTEDGTLNNDGAEQWTNTNAVYIIGTFNDSFTWGTPLANKAHIADRADLYSVMVLNSVDYLSHIYNPANSELNLFCRCYVDSQPYIGCFTFSLLGILNNLNFCQNPDFDPFHKSEIPLKFYWRQPSLSQEFIENERRSWTDNENLIRGAYIQEAPYYDRFVRIMGGGSTDSQVLYTTESGIISTHVIPDGTYMLLYDSEQGIRSVFSRDSGHSWMGSNLVYARNARSGTIIGSNLFYISTSGIEMKKTNYPDFYSGRQIASQNITGILTEDKEIEVQESLDNIEHYLIGSGPVGIQRLSGYITPEGITRIYFYDNNSVLKCMESEDTLEWKVSDNF